MPDRPDRKTMIEEVVRSLPRRNSQLDRLLSRGAKLPLRRGMASVLTALGDEPRSITALAEREGLAQPTVTRMIARLEALGYVERVRAPPDRRVVLVRITAEGQATLDGMRARYRALLRDELSAFSDAEIETVVAASRVLQQLIERMQSRARGGG